MPYISQESRNQYIPLIEKAVKLICEDTEFRRAENLGFFAQTLFFRFMGATEYCNMEFVFLDNDKIQSLNRLCDSFCEHLLNNHDIFSQAGELNYAISSVVWGVLGDSMYSGGPARYGFRTYVKGILLRISDCLDKTTNSRRSIIGQGVISDIIDEMYRRKTAIYEDQKIKENGDVWPLRNISFIEKVNIEPRKDEENFD